MRSSANGGHQNASPVHAFVGFDVERLGERVGFDEAGEGAIGEHSLRSEVAMLHVVPVESFAPEDARASTKNAGRSSAALEWKIVGIPLSCFAP